MIEWWTAVTQPQATLLAAVVTVVGAIVGIWLGSSFFAGKVRDLKTALDASRALLDEHAAAVGVALVDVGDRVKNIAEAVKVVDSQVAANSSSVAQIQGDVIDIQASVGQSAAVAETDTGTALREHWNTIRDNLETIASDTDIDGRTRAKYSRMDRRSYPDLIASIERDGNLPNAALYYEAADIWHRYRNGRKAPSAADVDRMAAIRKVVEQLPANQD